MKWLAIWHQKCPHAPTQTNPVCNSSNSCTQEKLKNSDIVTNSWKPPLERSRHGANRTERAPVTCRGGCACKIHMVSHTYPSKSKQAHNQGESVRCRASRVLLVARREMQPSHSRPSITHVCALFWHAIPSKASFVWCRSSFDLLSIRPPSACLSWSLWDSRCVAGGRGHFPSRRQRALCVSRLCFVTRNLTHVPPFRPHIFMHACMRDLPFNRAPVPLFIPFTYMRPRCRWMCVCFPLAFCRGLRVTWTARILCAFISRLIMGCDHGMLRGSARRATLWAREICLGCGGEMKSIKVPGKGNGFGDYNFWIALRWCVLPYIRRVIDWHVLITQLENNLECNISVAKIYQPK